MALGVAIQYLHRQMTSLYRGGGGAHIDPSNGGNSGETDP